MYLIIIIATTESDTDKTRWLSSSSSYSFLSLAISRGVCSATIINRHLGQLETAIKQRERKG
jgi:hypothetical protein